MLEALQAARLALPVLQLGLPDRFIEHKTMVSCCRCFARRRRVSSSIRPDVRLAEKDSGSPS